MSEAQYAYAVSRIRSKELLLLNNQFLDQLIASNTYQDALQLLTEKGWGNADGAQTAEILLNSETEKTWDLIGEMVDDMSVFDVFLYANDYHNLKAAIKTVYTDSKLQNVFIPQGTIDPQTILEAIRETKYEMLPERMRQVAEEALQTLLHTKDSQLCDIMIDKAALDAIYDAGKESDNELISLYAEISVAIADIKTSVRAQRTSKSYDFIMRALAECDTLDIKTLAQAAANSFEAICEYLLMTEYAGAVEALNESPSAFERWSDNLIMEKIRPQIYNPFTIGPLAAYILARENEIKTVRIILSGKLNDLAVESIRERLRDMYV